MTPARSVNSCNSAFLRPFRLAPMKILGAVEYIGRVKDKTETVSLRNILINQRLKSSVNLRPFPITMHKHASHAKMRLFLIRSRFV